MKDSFLSLLNRIFMEGASKRCEFNGGLAIFEGVGGYDGGLVDRIVRHALEDDRPDGGIGGALTTVFEHDGNRIRVKMIDGEPWFCLADVCKALCLKNITEVRRRLNKKGLSLTETLTPGGMQRLYYINEQNLYKVILRSNKPEAEAFSDWVTGEVLPSIRKTGGYHAKPELPDFITRLRLNYNHVPKTHFSVLNELYQRLYLQFEQVGYILPDISTIGKTLMPDISVGLCFAKYLRRQGYDWKDCKKYKHHFADGRVVDAYAYPNMLLPAFISFVNEEWLPFKAHNYLKDKDPKALDYLTKLLEG